MKKSGFTIVELLIVIGVMAGLSTLFITSYPATQKRARDAERRSDLKQIHTSLEAYGNKHNGVYPVQEVEGPAENIRVTLGVLSQPFDPDYLYISNASGTDFVLWTPLEQPDDSNNTVYFIVCSNGVSQELDTEPTSSACP